MSLAAVLLGVVIALCAGCMVLYNLMVSRRERAERALREAEEGPQDAEGLDERLAAARAAYDAAAARFNADMERFPGVIIAAMFGLTEMPSLDERDADGGE
jgi:hypothetical protein